MNYNFKKMYDVIIIGAGAGGLYAAAQMSDNLNVLILDKSSSPGKKLLMSGGGQCNLTHSGDIKDFVSHYGTNGNKIRSVLYRHNNLAVIKFFESIGISLIEREDGKIFPESMKAQEVLYKLLETIKKKGFEIKHNAEVTSIVPLSPDSEIQEGILDECPRYTVFCGEESFHCKNLIIATGGCSYPSTGSDGSMFAILKELGLALVPVKQALVPIFVQNYGYSKLSGISVPQVALTVNNGKKPYLGALLFTHTNLSGPVILKSSRYICTGDKLSINYFPGKSKSEFSKELKSLSNGNNRQIDTVISEYSSKLQNPLSKRFIEVALKGCQGCNFETFPKASLLSGKQIDDIAGKFTCDTFSVSGLGSYNTAMATSGGISLCEINMKNMEAKKYPHLHIIGEALDIDGDTGGYNLQFAFSSAYASCK